MKGPVLIVLLFWGWSWVQRCPGEATLGGSGFFPDRGVYFEQRLSVPVSLDTTFLNDDGHPVLLRDLFHGRPVILAMGYYQCPMLCGVILNAFVQSLQEFPPQSSARDFDFIFISVDPAEESRLALAKKQLYMQRYGWPAAEGRWHFLTGSKESIQTIADEIGFHFRYDRVAKQYMHPSGIVVLTSKGKVSGYLLGVEFPPSKLQQAIALARQNEVGRSAENIWLLCYSSNPVSGPMGRIVLYALRIGAVLTLLSLFLVIRFVRRVRREGIREVIST